HRAPREWAARSHGRLSAEAPEMSSARRTLGSSNPDDLLGIGPMQCRGEQQNIQSEESICDRNESRTLERFDEIPERYVQEQHGGQRGQKQPLQIFDAAAGAAGVRHWNPRREKSPRRRSLRHPEPFPKLTDGKRLAEQRR